MKRAESRSNKYLSLILVHLNYAIISGKYQTIESLEEGKNIFGKIKGLSFVFKQWFLIPGK